MSNILYSNHAQLLFDNGYLPLPLIHKAKRPSISNWPNEEINQEFVSKHSQTKKNLGIGLITGQLIGIDIDVYDKEGSQKLAHLIQKKYGKMIRRIGLFPKICLYCRSSEVSKKMLTTKYFDPKKLTM